MKVFQFILLLYVFSFYAHGQEDNRDRPETGPNQENALKRVDNRDRPDTMPSQENALKREDNRDRPDKGPRKLTKKDCREGKKILEQRGQKCLSKKNFNNRKRCFNNAPNPVVKKYGKDFMEGPVCRQMLKNLERRMVNQERKRYPNQASAFRGEDNRNRPNKGPRKITKKDCTQARKVLEARGKSCLQKRKFTNRKRCFNNAQKEIENKFGKEFFDGPVCRPMLKDLESKMVKHESTRYPKQPSSFGANDGQSNQMAMKNKERRLTPADCKQGVVMMEKGSKKCLGKKNFKKRSQCFENISRPVKKRFGDDFFDGPACRSMLDQLKQKVMREEKSKYPDQKSALEDK